MATTGELRAIIEELELVDIGDAASYLGEEVDSSGRMLVAEQAAIYVDTMEHFVIGHCDTKRQSV